jgi:hypothetical protein
MSKEAKEAHGQTKRPYEKPRVESSEIFGAEAMTGSCCRSTVGSCTNTTRNNRRTAIDPSKIRVSTVS